MARASFMLDRFDSARAALVPLGVIFVLAGCTSDLEGEAASADDLQVTRVRAAEVRVADQEAPLRFAGVVRPRQRATLTFQIGGVVRERPVEIGDAVAAGAMLARLFNPELEPARAAAHARVSEVVAQAEQARLDAERAVQLHTQGMLSAQVRDREVARWHALRASTASARAALSQTEQLRDEMRLSAPFAGIVEAVLVEPGEYVAPGQPVVRLAAEQGREVELQLPANLLDGLNVGDRLPVLANGERLDGMGRIIEIGRSTSQASVLYPMVISLDDVAVRTGDAVEVALVRKRAPHRAVPFAAVMRSADGLSVFRLEGDRVRRVSVEVTGFQGEWALLDRQSLREGDKVVYSGLTRLADNDVVRLLP